MVVFDSDEVQAIYEPGDSAYLLITFGTVAMRANDQGFFGQPVTRQAKIAALGFMAKRPNWYPAADMRRASAALKGIWDSHQERIIYGYSMGAYAAVKFSGLFETQTCIAIAPQFSIDPKDVGHFDRGYLHFHADELHNGMAPGAADVSGTIFILYDNKWPVDVEHMKLYSNAVNPILLNVPYTGHETMRPFTGTKIAVQLFDLCRTRDISALNELIAERRRPHPIRAFHVAFAAVAKHPAWALQILQHRCGEMDTFQIHELAARIGQQALRKNLFALAEVAFHLALPVRPTGDIRAAWGLASLCRGRDDIGAAAAWARRAIDDDPRDTGIRGWLADTLLRSGDLPGARAEAEAGLAIAPNDTGLLHCMTDLAEREHRLNDAAAWVRRAIQSAPGQAYLRERLVQLLMRLEDWAAARTEAVAALEGHPRSIGLLRSLADIAEREQQPDNAVAWMRQAIEAAPDQGFMQERIVYTLMRQKKWADARTEAMAALEHRPNAAGLLRAMTDLCDRVVRTKR